MMKIRIEIKMKIWRPQQQNYKQDLEAFKPEGAVGVLLFGDEEQVPEVVEVFTPGGGGQVLVFAADLHEGVVVQVLEDVVVQVLEGVVVQVLEGVAVQL